ncbi:MAG: hypothetical protein KA347_04400 [Bacteroidia bacterium]|jgi:hypothetical protein|nr:hypothetical protein [Bacteroidia bacterium]MBP7245084.1 hypothetical protein [Bacteroidia bacterium]
MKQLLISLGFLCLMTACKKEAGEGGNSVIQGKILERTYTAFPSIYSDKAALEKDVYIIYGDDHSSFDDRTRTSFDGSYKFEFLRKGKYRIFVYTEDTVLTNFGKEVPIILDTEIKKNRSEVNLPTVTTVNL